MDLHTYLRNFPDARGRFGEYGGVYLPDELVPAFEEITEAYQTIAQVGFMVAAVGVVLIAVLFVLKFAFL